MQGKRLADVANRMHVTVPKTRDNISRPPVIPSSVLKAKAKAENEEIRTERTLQVLIYPKLQSLNFNKFPSLT